MSMGTHSLVVVRGASQLIQICSFQNEKPFRENKLVNPPPPDKPLSTISHVFFPKICQCSCLPISVGFWKTCLWSGNALPHFVYLRRRIQDSDYISQKPELNFPPPPPHVPQNKPPGNIKTFFFFNFDGKSSRKITRKKIVVAWKKTQS